jgi:hypothetical protein
MSSRFNGFISKSMITFQGAMKKFDSYRSNSAITRHAENTVKKGRDLSTP